MRIGIVDSGVDATHPDLVGKVDVSATCVGGPCREGAAIDDDGHGTAVAGIAVARAGNGAGTAGVAPDAHLVVAKALRSGVGSTDDIANAIQWVVDHGARVVNLSLGDSDRVLVRILGTPLQSSIEYAWSRGAIPVMAAGNYDEDVVERGSSNYGNLDAVVVGATGKDGRVTDYSTALGDAKWGVVAPGGQGDGSGSDIVSSAPGGRYEWAAGTSMAAPHVSGTLALLLAQGLSPAQAVRRLLETLDRSVPCGAGCQGLVRADAAVGRPANRPPAKTDAAATGPARPRAPGRLSPVLIGLASALAALSAAASASALWRRPGCALSVGKRE
ncbi:MAG: S8 family peptidase, partial [Acidimicrobiales bacterium]